MSKEKKRWGDRRDGKLIRDIDALHYVTSIIFPNRCDNEAFISERIDLTNINEYLKRKNEVNDDGYEYNLFQVLLTSIVKVLTLRPVMNRFIVNDRFYQRNEVSASFVVKKVFDDKGGEALAFLHLKDEDNINTIHKTILDQISYCRSDEVDDSSEAMEMFNKMPRWMSRLLIHASMKLDRRGLLPKSFCATDPYYASVVLSNLGSIQLKSGYHHLTNWGTCSMIVLIGEIKDRPVFKNDGTFEMRPSVDLGLTIDERIGDGYYYSRTMKLLRKLLQEPELLERPLSEEVDY